MSIKEIGLLAVMYILESAKCLVGYTVFFKERPRKIYGMAAGLVLFIFLCVSVRIDETVLRILLSVIVYLSVLLSVKGKVIGRGSKVLLLFCIISCFDEVTVILMELGIRVGNATLMDVLEGMVSLVELSIISILVRKRMFCLERLLELVQKSIYILIALIISFVLFTLSFIPFVTEHVNNEKFKMLTDVFSIFAFLCVGLLIVFVIYIRNMNEKLKKTVEIKIELEEMQKKYYEAQLEKEEATRRYRHDMEGKLQGLMALARKENAASIEAYIGKLQADIHNIKRCLYETGIDILDVILTYNLQSLADVEIRVIGKCRKAFEIENVDFSAIFSNLIRNAVEAVEKQRAGDKHIYIKIEQGEEYIRFEIENSTDRCLEITNDRKIRTSKEDKKNHGFGLSNTEEMIKHNGGMFDVMAEKHTFKAIVTFRYSESITTVQRVN